MKGVIGAAYEVSNALGAGFLEKIYERALILELVLRGLTAQCIKYLKASHLRLGLLIDFQKPKVEWKRIVFG